MKRVPSEPWCFATQNRSHGPAAPALSVKRLEMQSLGPILDVLHWMVGQMMDRWKDEWYSKWNFGGK